jgi:hypothetical protein
VTRRSAGTVAAIAGRRFDRPGGPRRFPPSNESLVRVRLREVLTRHGVQIVISSAACGTDLIALETAAELGVRRIVFLPHDPEVFRERSVLDRAPAWGPRFDRVIETVRAAGDLHNLGLSGTGDALYRATNDAMLAETLKVVQTSGGTLDALAVIVWNGESRGPDDLTDHFRQMAQIRGLPIEVVDTL